MLGLAPEILSQPKAIFEPGNCRFVLEAPPVHDEQSVRQVRVRHPQVQVTSVIIDIRLQGVAEPEDRCDRHERVVPISASSDFSAAVLGPGRVCVDGAVLRIFVEVHSLCPRWRGHGNYPCFLHQ